MFINHYNNSLLFKVGYSTWESTLTIESVLNSDHGLYQCWASNELGNDTFNISLTGKARPEPPVNLEVAMTEDQKTVQLRVSSVLASLPPRKLCLYVSLLCLNSKLSDV